MLEADSGADKTIQTWQEAGIENADATLRQAGLEGRIHHTRQKFITLYDPQGNARRVPRGNLSMCLRSGMSATCPLCQGYHADLSPNQCPSREPLLRTLCPLCGKPVYEDRLSEERQGPADDPLYVSPKLPQRADREAALQRKLEIHMTAFHQTEARMLYGLQPPPEQRR